ncbi:MAG: hypothetical protein JNM19_18955 [Chitinophagaceae bacterium]|nr:hypothetical protein [Chitinophagaceae bacterium]
MRYLLMSIGCCCLLHKANTQVVETSGKTKAVLVTEISLDDIEQLYLGCLTCISKPRKKADSLFATLPLDQVLLLTDHPSYTIRYYSFLRLLRLNDTMAFDFLEKNINDSVMVDVKEACMYSSYPFNKMILDHTAFYANSKCKGVSCTTGGQAYCFTPSDRSSGRFLKKKLKAIVKKQVPIYKKDCPFE